MEPNWARDLRDQCRDTGAALFLKQMWKRQAIPCRSDGARVSGALISGRRPQHSCGSPLRYAS
jgi:protein gp37